MICLNFLLHLITEKYIFSVLLPNHDDDKVEHVPSAPKIGSRMLPESISHDLHHALAGEDHQEHVFNFLLLRIKNRH